MPRLRLTLATLAALVAVAGATARADPATPPLSLSLAWDGAPCNADGRIVVTIINQSGAPLAVPQAGGLGFGALFIARIATGGHNAGSIGDGFLTPYSDEVLHQLVVLQPRASRSYRYVLFDRHDGVGDDFSPAYAAMLRDGGRLSVLYALNDSVRRPDSDPRLYFVRPDLLPAIDSNTLACPPRR